jgi:hypothetical protein
MSLKDTWKKLSTLQKGLAIGLPVVAVGGIALAMRKKDDASSAQTTPDTKKPDGTTPVSPPGTTTPPFIEATYTNAPTIALNHATLPVLRAQTGSTAASSYWILGDEAAGPVSDALIPILGLPPVAASSAAQTGAPGKETFIADLGAQVALSGAGTLPPADVWFVVLGKDQAAADVAATQQSIAQIRKVLPNQRILWVLSYSAPGSIAKAISEAKEEWIRSEADDAALVASDIVKASMAADGVAINAAFPPPGTPVTTTPGPAVPNAPPPGPATAPAMNFTCSAGIYDPAQMGCVDAQGAVIDPTCDDPALAWDKIAGTCGPPVFAN